jgi:E3 ubiquitin-protein ligase RGLG
MGCGASASATSVGSRGSRVDVKPKGFQMIPDRYTTYSQVSDALRKAGLESSQLVVGVDFTKSNKWTGAKTFGGRCLHELNPTRQNPYQKVLSVIAKSLADFDDDGLIPAYGFGDCRTKSKRVFSFHEDDTPCDGLGNVLQRYERVVKTLNLSGPTNFGPIIRQATELVRRSGEYHILLLIADGQVDEVNDTVNAIVEASHHALSIIMIGVGDGPWGLMEEFDDLLPQRKFDNFQFVDFDSVCRKYPPETRDCAFAVHALMEIPEQYEFVKRNGMLGGMQTGKSLQPHPHWQPPLGPPEASLSGEPEEEENPHYGDMPYDSHHSLKPTVVNGMPMMKSGAKIAFAY